MEQHGNSSTNDLLECNEHMESLSVSIPKFPVLSFCRQITMAIEHCRRIALHTMYHKGLKRTRVGVSMPLSKSFSFSPTPNMQLADSKAVPTCSCNHISWTHSLPAPSPSPTQGPFQP